MLSDKETRSRRTVLKTIPASGLSLLAAGTVTATKDERAIDSDFNPKNKREVAQFVDEAFAYGEQVEAKTATTSQAEEQLEAERERIQERLTEDQFDALETFWDEDLVLEVNREVTSVNFETGADQTDASPADDYWELASFEETVTANVTVPRINKSYDAFDYTHSVEWEHKSLEGVRAINSTGSGDGNRFLLAKWSYNGDEDEDITIRQDGNFFTSDLTGVFDRCVLIGTSFTCTTTDRMYTRVNGNWNGTGKLVRSELR